MRTLVQRCTHMCTHMHKHMHTDLHTRAPTGPKVASISASLASVSSWARPALLPA